MSILYTLIRNLKFYGFFKTIKFEFRHAIWLVNKFILGNEFVQRKIHDYKMLLCLRISGIAYDLYLYGTREDDVREMLLRDLKPGNNVLELGGNIGYYALMDAMIIGKEGKIIAFEPDHRNFELLKKNVSLNNMDEQIETHEAAISDTDEEKELAAQERSNTSYIVSDKKAIRSETPVNTVKVKTINIYNLLQNSCKIDFIRMDIEGHEVEVFNGLIRLLKEKPDLVPHKILFEAHHKVYDDEHHNMKEKLIEMFNFGYKVKTITAQNEKTSTIKDYGYKVWKYSYSDFHVRGMYDGISNEHALKLICDTGCVRTVFLERNEAQN